MFPIVAGSEAHSDGPTHQGRPFSLHAVELAPISRTIEIGQNSLRIVQASLRKRLRHPAPFDSEVAVHRRFSWERGQFLVWEAESPAKSPHAWIGAEEGQLRGVVARVSELLGHGWNR
jgi:hypothetical protein